MSDPAVNWHEGMFLRPHHFQAATRHWHDQLRQSGRWDVHYNWGLRTLDFDADALKNYRFVVHRLEARLRDGTLVRVPQDGALAPFDLRADLERRSPVEVLLAVPAVQLGRANVGPDADGARYRAYTPRDGIPDENTGQNARPVQLRQLNLRLITGGQDPAGYEVLPVARVERSAQAEAVPQVQEVYIPPVLACDAWEPLRRGILGQVYNRIGKLVKQRAQQVRSRRITFDSNSPGDRRIFETLRVLNEAAAHLGVLAGADGVHPLPAYLELCRLVGRLAIFGADPEVPDLPAYDHDDLGGCFYAVKRYIDDLLSKDFDLGYEERPFVGEGLRMRVRMEPAWLAPAWQMFVGVESPLPAGEVVPLLTQRLNMKIGSADHVDDIFQRGLRGLVFTANPKPPRALPESRTLTYFQISRDTSPDEWQHVQNTLALAIRLNERLVAGNIQDQKVVTIRAEGQTTTLQFTLYVVPQALAAKTGGG
jgi:type VI secretion system protein ImpJ